MLYPKGVIFFGPEVTAPTFSSFPWPVKALLLPVVLISQSRMSSLYIYHSEDVYILMYWSVFQPFCCRGTLRKREDHSRNSMHWSVSPATYARISTGYLRTHFPSRALRAEPSWRRQNRQRRPI